MTDYTELKRLLALGSLPPCVGVLIAENERLAAACERAEQVINAESKAAAIAIGRANLMQTERDQLKAENNRLQSAAYTLARIGYTDRGGELWKPPIGQKPNFDQIDQLRAEVAGLKTGYEACERVNAELKAEVELLESSRAKLAGELSRLRAKHKDWSVIAALGQGEKS